MTAEKCSREEAGEEAQEEAPPPGASFCHGSCCHTHPRPTPAAPHRWAQSSGQSRLPFHWIPRPTTYSDPHLKTDLSQALHETLHQALPPDPYWPPSGSAFSGSATAAQWIHTGRPVLATLLPPPSPPEPDHSPPSTPSASLQHGPPARPTSIARPAWAVPHGPSRSHHLTTTASLEGCVKA